MPTPIPGAIRTLRNRFARLRRSSVVRAPYYRRHPMEFGRLLHARRRLATATVAEPRDFLVHLGIDPKQVLADFDHWRDVLAPVLAGRSRTGVSAGQGEILYAVVRTLRPDHVIETGVAEGVSTSYIGAALVDNGRGILHSLELPPADVPLDTTLEDGGRYSWQRNGVAHLMPNEIRDALGDRWDMRFGDVRMTLPDLLTQVDSLGVFFHDDLHTPSHMLWEYELVWPRLASGGLLMSDDSNAGWVSFAERHLGGPEHLTNFRRLTAARRP